MQVKKNPNVDPGRNSLIFFQVGLIVMLTITYFGLEWRTYINDDIGLQKVQMSDFEQEEIPITQLNTPPPPPPPPPPPMPEVIEVIEDKVDVEETVIQSTETNQSEAIEVVEVADITYEEEEEEEEIENIPFMVVENIPIYPGCEDVKGKQAQKECMSAKIDAHVKREFRTYIGEELGLTGLNRIFVIFKIDEKGDVADIRVRGPNKKLEQEAVRVVKLLPKMKPGKQRDKPVAVEYSLPIMFEVRERI